MFVVIYHILHYVRFSQMTEDKSTKLPIAAGNRNFNSKIVTAMNSTNKTQIEFLKRMDEILFEQIINPTQKYSLTILHNINEYNKVLKYILSKLLAKSVLTRIRMLSTAEIVSTKLKPKFVSVPINYFHTKNIFNWDDFDMRGLLASIKTAKDMWTDITEAIDLVKIDKLKNDKKRATFLG